MGTYDRLARAWRNGDTETLDALMDVAEADAGPVERPEGVQLHEQAQPLWSGAER